MRRVAWCVIRVIVLCAVLAACSSPDTWPPTPAKVLAVPTLSRDVSGVASEECTDDIEAPTVEPGWKIVWRHVFDNPIALPPAIDGAQMFLLERMNPVPKENVDTLWSMEPQTGAVQWKFDDIADFKNRTGRSRLIRRVVYSPKYLALQMQYLMNPFEPVKDYVVVLDRVTGETIYQAALPTEKEITVTDDAFYYRGGDRVLHRVDLPSGIVRWRSPSNEGAEGFVFAVEPWLYAVTGQRNIHRYSPVDGTIVATAILGGQPQSVQAVQGQVVLVHTAYQFEGVTAFNLRNLEQQWSSEIDYFELNYGFDFPSSATTDAFLYLFDAGSSLVQLDLKNGQVTWKNSSIGGRPLSRPVATHDLIYGFFVDGTIRAFSMTDGRQVAVVAKTPFWNRRNPDLSERSVYGGLGVADNTLIVTTGCRSVFALQREP